jgi:hypothetical protein
MVGFSFATSQRKYAFASIVISDFRKTLKPVSYVRFTDVTPTPPLSAKTQGVVTLRRDFFIFLFENADKAICFYVFSHFSAK